jgi:nucleoredoxin
MVSIVCAASYGAEVTIRIMAQTHLFVCLSGFERCGPCRQFTPELVSFYNKMNSRRGKENEFEIVWISRCRDFDSFGQYFTNMNWLAMQPELAMGQHGQDLSTKYKVKGIPSLVLLDEVGNVITTDARNKIPQDRTGMGFPWRNPLTQVYVTVVPKSLRLLLRTQIDGLKGKINKQISGLLSKRKATA